MTGMEQRVESTRRKVLCIPGYDYSTPGSYFVTICASDRLSRFSTVSEDGLYLTPAGSKVELSWMDLPTRFPGVEVDEFVAMPDHLHGILWLIAEDMDAGRVSLGKVIQAYKSLTTKHYINGVRNQGWPSFAGRLWQPNYYEHII